MLTEMVKVRIVGLKAVFSQAFEAIYSLGKVQFEDLRPKIDDGELPLSSMRLPDDGEEQKGALIGLAQRTRTFCEAVGLDEEGHASEDVENDLLEASTEHLLEAATDFLDDFETTASPLIKTRDDSESELTNLEKYKPLMPKVGSVVSKLTGGDFDEFDSVALLVEERYSAIFTSLEKDLRAMSDDRTRVVAAAEPDDDGIVPMVVVFGQEFARAIRGYLQGEKATQIKLPDEFTGLSLTEALTELEKRSTELTELIEETKAKIEELADSQGHRLLQIKDAADDRIEEFGVLEQFGETSYTFVIEGYVPKRDYAALEEALPVAEGKVILENMPLDPHDYPDVPVQIEPRKGMLGSFRAAIGLWGSPEYGTIDPTLILAISFPIIFGMIVGDAGYGLLMVIGCLILRKKLPDNVGVKNITGVLFPAGIVTTIFGVFYFEFFGNLAHEYIPGLKNIHPIELGSSFSFPFMRTESNLMTTLLFMAIGLGVLEVVIGLVFGIINGKRLGHKKHIWEKGGILTIIFSAMMLAVAMMMPTLTASLGASGAAVFRYVAYLLLAVGLISTLFGGGIMGAIEMLEAVSHAASYIRIMAVGLVGALLADAANELAFKTMPNVAGVAIALILHILNFAIICFSPSIHALRLNFLEFFGKFFERGTKEYKPFVRVGKEGKL
ncbi:MAG: hypothetical protein FWD65_04715 [Coriobacteriia bacterium]|nr:hypothetical protein [Coriobacteriia bacterium]